MDRAQILKEIAESKKKSGCTSSSCARHNPFGGEMPHATVLFSRGAKVWWLHHNSYGEAEIEVEDYGVN